MNQHSKQICVRIFKFSASAFVARKTNLPQLSSFHKLIIYLQCFFFFFFFLIFIDAFRHK